MVTNNKNIFSNAGQGTLTAAFSDETSVYKTLPEFQNSEVVTAKQEKVSRFLHVAPQSLYYLKCPEKKYISAT